MIFDTSEATFEQDVIERSRELPVVVDFWAAWCGPCRMVAPEMEKLAEKYDGAVKVVKLDVDANPRVSQHFNVMSIPFIAFFPNDGSQPIGRPGFRPLEAMEREFNLARFASTGAAPSQGNGTSAETA